MVATTMVVTPPFARSRPGVVRFESSSGLATRASTRPVARCSARRTERPATLPTTRLCRSSGSPRQPSRRSLIQISQQAKIDITIALGVPMSLIGNASQRTYANADSEYKNFWTLNILPMIADLQDYVNTFLAPRIGMEVGWFDLSRVAALKPPAVFAPPMIGDVINFGVADAPTVANLLGIPAANASADSDTDTVDVGVESATGTSISGSGGGLSHSGDRTLYGITKDQLLSARLRWEQRPLNSYNVDREFHQDVGHFIEREVIRVRKPKELEPVPALPTPQATMIVRHVEEVKRRSDEQARLLRSAAVRERTEAMAAQARQWITELRTRGDELGAYDLEEFITETHAALHADRATWVGVNGHMTDTLTQSEIDAVHDHADPDKALTAWDGNLDSFDAWVDARTLPPALEALSGSA